MAVSKTYARDGRMFHVDYTVSGTSADAEVEIDVTNDGTWNIDTTLLILDFSADKHAGTLTTMSPVLSSVSGSTKARDTIQPAAGTAVRPSLGAGVPTYLGTGTSLWLDLNPDTSHATNDIRGRITFSVPGRGL